MGFTNLSAVGTYKIYFYLNLFLLEMEPSMGLM